MKLLTIVIGGCFMVVRSDNPISHTCKTDSDCSDLAAGSDRCDESSWCVPTVGPIAGHRRCGQCKDIGENGFCQGVQDSWTNKVCVGNRRCKSFAQTGAGMSYFFVSLSLSHTHTYTHRILRWYLHYSIKQSIARRKRLFESVQFYLRETAESDALESQRASFQGHDRERWGSVLELPTPNMDVSMDWEIVRVWAGNLCESVWGK